MMYEERVRKIVLLLTGEVSRSSLYIYIYIYIYIEREREREREKNMR